MMNERIKLLYEQSLTRENTKDANGNPMIVIKQNPEKFAELIVRECAAMTRNLSPHGELAERAVKEHFGVEE
jgi:hypothetical protein